MKAINAAMKSFFSLFNRHFDKIKGRRIYEHYKFTLQCILSDFPPQLSELHPCQDSRTGKAALNAE